MIAGLFVAPLLPSRRDTAPPVYTVDLVGGEKIGKSNFGTELSPPPKQASQSTETKPVPVTPETKKEVKVAKEEKVEKLEKIKPLEKKIEIPERSELKEKLAKESVKREPAKEIKEDSKTETASADSVRERLLQSAIERAKSRTDTGQKASKGEMLSAGNGEGDGASGLGSGGRGGPGIVKGMDFIIYQNRMLGTIKDNWVWTGQRSNLRVVVHFSIKETGEIVGLKIVQASGDASYDESVLRAVKKSSPLPAPPESYRKDFADVELTFRPRDLGA
ncbi:MAG TPA: cell envelope integrity protein TolA [Terriglobales bacterium]|nr:cell envelope integrity protein TolA [Terriglobales bacterium]